MKVYPSAKIRNICVVAHQGAGKTSLTEAMVYNTGAINRLGKVEDGNTVSDYHPEEIKRKSSVNTSLVACAWQDCKINVLDVPGFSDFFGEVSGALRVADTALMVVDAVAGCEVSTEIMWERADETELPIIVFINKMDRENADFHKAIDSMSAKLTRQIIPVQLPIGQEAAFSGVVDLINQKAYKFENGKAVEIPVPADMADDVETYREAMIEAAAEGEDEITMKYLDGEELTAEEIVTGLSLGIASGKVVPALCGAATKNIGVSTLMDFINAYVPNPLAALGTDAASKPVAALIFKTLADTFVGKISMFKVMQGKMKGDTIMYNANKEADEKVAALNTLIGKTQEQIPEFDCGDIGTVSKLSAASTGDT